MLIIGTMSSCSVSSTALNGTCFTQLGDIQVIDGEFIENGLFVRASGDSVDELTGEVKEVTVLVPSSTCLFREQ